MNANSASPVADPTETIELNPIGTNGTGTGGMKYDTGGVTEAAKLKLDPPKHWNRGGPPAQLSVEDPMNVGKNACIELTELFMVAEPLLTPFMNQKTPSPSEKPRSTDRSVPRLVSNGWTSNVNALLQLKGFGGSHAIVPPPE
jgi:hypothetical protein